jgi:GNAT superfamily N-acetyltransferase
MINAGQDTVQDALEIRPLLSSDVDQLRLSRWSRLAADELVRLLDNEQGASVWMPATHEFAIVTPWRHRELVAHLIDLVAVRHPVDLTRAAIERARDTGARLFLVVEASERRQDSFYEQAGLRLLETVLSYELLIQQPDAHPDGTDGIEHVSDLSGPLLDELMNVDADAFPWLWQNSGAEFREYIGQPGVEIYILRSGGQPIAYLGISVFPGWGHIDRVAVRGAWQGKGFGRRLTEFAVHRLATLGARRVGLTTQLRNIRSQNLYTAIGFRRQPASDYRMYGLPLWQNDSIDDLVMGR